MKYSRPLDIARLVYASYEKQDFSMFHEIITEETTFFFPSREDIVPWAGTFKGQDIFRFLEIIKQHLDFDYYKDTAYFESTYRDVAHYKEGVEDDSDVNVIVLCEELFTVKLTGKKVFNKLAGLFAIQDEKIKRYFEYADTGAMERGFQS